MRLWLAAICCCWPPPGGGGPWPSSPYSRRGVGRRRQSAAFGAIDWALIMASGWGRPSARQTGAGARSRRSTTRTYRPNRRRRAAPSQTFIIGATRPPGNLVAPFPAHARAGGGTPNAYLTMIIDLSDLLVTAPDRSLDRRSDGCRAIRASRTSGPGRCTPTTGRPSPPRATPRNKRPRLAEVL